MYTVHSYGSVSKYVITQVITHKTALFFNEKDAHSYGKYLYSNRRNNRDFLLALIQICWMDFYLQL